MSRLSRMAKRATTSGPCGCPDAQAVFEGLRQPESSTNHAGLALSVGSDAQDAQRVSYLLADGAGAGGGGGQEEGLNQNSVKLLETLGHRWASGRPGLFPAAEVDAHRFESMGIGGASAPFAGAPAPVATSLTVSEASRAHAGSEPRATAQVAAEVERLRDYGWGLSIASGSLEWAEPRSSWAEVVGARRAEAAPDVPASMAWLEQNRAEVTQLLTSEQAVYLAELPARTSGPDASPVPVPLPDPCAGELQGALVGSAWSEHALELPGGTESPWSQLTAAERAEWMAESPEQAAAPRGGSEPAAVNGHAELQPRSAPEAKPLPAGLGGLDRAALGFWFRLSPGEQQRSTMKPVHSLERSARMGGKVAR